MSNTQLLDQALTMLVGLILPILVALVTTRATDARVKAILLALLSAVTGLVGEWATSPHGWDWRAAVLLAVGSFVAAVASHFGLLKPSGATPWVQANIGVTGSDTSGGSAL